MPGRRILDSLASVASDWVRDRYSERVTIGGISFQLWIDDPQRTELIWRLECALSLLSQLDPRAGARLKRNVAIVFVGDLVGWLSFDERNRVLALSQEFILAQGSQELVLTFVHGATEAWLSRPDGHAGRDERVVRLAYRAQLNSARRWPDPPAPLLELLEEQVASQDLFLSGRELRTTLVDWFRARDVPEWLIRPLERLLKRKERESLH